MQKMEHLTNAADSIRDEVRSKIVQDRPPTFVVVPESFKLTQEQAADILKKPLFKLNDSWADFALLPEDKLEPTMVILRDAACRGRHSLLITDTTEGVVPEERLMMIREMDGTLRHANSAERYLEAKRIWGKDSKKFVKRMKNGNRETQSVTQSQPIFYQDDGTVSSHCRDLPVAS